MSAYKLVLIMNTLIAFLSMATTGATQELILIISIFALHYFLKKKYSISDKIYYVFSLLLFVHIMCIYLQYLNSIFLGFDDGLFKPIKSVGFGSDDANYYYESLAIYQYIFDYHNLSNYLNGDCNVGGLYGPYNPYNIFNVILMYFWGGNLISLILIKLHLLVGVIYMLLFSAQRYLMKKYAVLSVCMTVLNPAYIVVTSTLMRDDIIVFLIIALFALYTKQGFTKKEILFICIIGLLLLFFRIYAFAILTLSLCLYKFIHQFSFANIMISLLSIILLGGLLISFFGIERFVINIIEYDNQQSWDSSRSEGIKLLFYSLYYHIFCFTASADIYQIRTFSGLFNYLGQVYLNFILLISSLSIFYAWREKIKYFILIFCNIMPIVYLLLITFIYGGPIPRLYNMWIWAISIGFCYVMQKCKYKYYLVFIILCFIAQIYFIKSIIN